MRIRLIIEFTLKENYSNFLSEIKRQEAKILNFIKEKYWIYVCVLYYVTDMCLNSR